MKFPPEVDVKLAGWQLFWAEIKVNSNGEALTRERETLPSRLRTILKGLPIAEHPTVRSVRSLFRNAGCDPTRYRPSSEALARRISKGDPLPAILPAVDINNIWSVELMVPCCVINPSKLNGPVTLRRGQSGEMMDSMRGPFNLEGKPTLVDKSGAFGSPITDSERVAVKTAKGTFWLVAYLPQNVVTEETAAKHLKDLIKRVGGAEVLSTSS